MISKQTTGKLIRYSLVTGLAIIIVGLLLVVSGFKKVIPEIEGSPLSPIDFVLDKKGNQVIVAQKTALRVDFLSLTSGQVKASISTRLPPTGICFNRKDKAYISCSYSEGEILIVDVNEKKIIDSIKVGHGAICPVLSPNFEFLYVADQYDNQISIIDLKKNATIARIPVLRQPRTMDITPDGRWLYVANFLPSTRADIDTVAAEISIIDLKEVKVVKHLKLANGSNALRGLKISPDGKHAYVVHNLGRFQVPTSQLEQGWMNTSALTVIDIPKQAILATVLLDEPENGAAGSWGVDVDDGSIAVSHSSTHDYSLIDRHAMFKKFKEIDDLETLSYDLRFLNGIRKRIPVSGEGPRAIKIEGDKILTALYYSDVIRVDDLEDNRNISRLSMNSNLVIDSVRLGEMLFQIMLHLPGKDSALVPVMRDNNPLPGHCLHLPAQIEYNEIRL